MATLLISIVLAGLASMACIAIHAVVTAALQARLRRKGAAPPSHADLLVSVSALLLAHVTEIAVFAIAFTALFALGAGGFTGTQSHDFAERMYVSAVIYTSLGFGDILPVGGARLLAGLEALVGLVLIAWTASFLLGEIFLRRIHTDVSGR